MNDNTKTIIKKVLFIIFIVILILLLYWGFSNTDTDESIIEPDSELVDKCKDVDCGEHGECIDGMCSCYDDWYGDKCENQRQNNDNYRYCDESDCSGNKKLIDDKMCRLDICSDKICCKDKNHKNKCKNVDCGENGRCSQGKCICKEGYSGDKCDVDIIYKTGSNIINDTVVSCNNNNDCSGGVCDPNLKTCVKICNNKDDICKYIGPSNSLNNYITSNCIKSSDKYVCPFGKMNCENNTDNMVQRLCDPLNNCTEVNGISNYTCTNNISPFIGFDNTKYYEANTSDGKTCWNEI